MIEVTGNLWIYPADVRVITTNGTVKKNGECVMGRGCAAEAKTQQPGVALALGRMLQQHGNHVHLLRRADPDGNIYSFVMYSFPVKHNWYEKADLDLIQRSAGELLDAVNSLGQTLRVVMPRPGCGNGHLNWSDVKPILTPILDDRFHVITF